MRGIAMKQPDPKAMDELLRKASQQMGTSANELKQQVENGKLDDIMKKLPKQQAESFQNILNNPELAKKLMESPQAQAIMKKFMSK